MTVVNQKIVVFDILKNDKQMTQRVSEGKIRPEKHIMFHKQILFRDFSKKNCI